METTNNKFELLNTNDPPPLKELVLEGNLEDPAKFKQALKMAVWLHRTCCGCAAHAYGMSMSYWEALKKYSPQAVNNLLFRIHDHTGSDLHMQVVDSLVQVEKEIAETRHVLDNLLLSHLEFLYQQDEDYQLLAFDVPLIEPDEEDLRGYLDELVRSIRQEDVADDEVMDVEEALVRFSEHLEDYQDGEICFEEEDDFVGRYPASIIAAMRIGDTACHEMAEMMAMEAALITEKNMFRSKDLRRHLSNTVYLKTGLTTWCKVCADLEINQVDRVFIQESILDNSVNRGIEVQFGAIYDAIHSANYAMKSLATRLQLELAALLGILLTSDTKAQKAVLPHAYILTAGQLAAACTEISRKEITVENQHPGSCMKAFVKMADATLMGIDSDIYK